MSQTVFPGVPFIESPLFEIDLPNSSLNATEREIAVQLNRNGFAVFDFPDPLLDERIERIRSRLAAHFGLAQDGSGDLAGLAGNRVQDDWRNDDDVRAIASNPGVLDLLTKLYGRRAFPFQTLNFPVGTQQALHTDSVHFSSLPERFMCGVWLAMEDVGPDSGALTYVPGSHRWPIMSNAIVGRRGWQSGLHSAQDPYADAWSAMLKTTGAHQETFYARKGQGLIWCANLLHGGSARLNDQLTRWSQVTHYYFDDCIYYTPAFSDESLGRLALRDITDASTGRQVPNRYLDEAIELVPPPSASSRPLGPRWWRRMRKAWRNILPSGKAT
ncbi:phytanoyl-CoA dioxygenase family protein [Sphingobium sp. H33]|uniref:Phytanoyl-CoA dioxygenase family protein n=2 Tax=Sphingobium nicotianae TaxID=2782607 RepID=A0A9X1IRJ4_9SPHN|nr:phytanoyl-CoA dioxygenase family protein [Sphingobium nicotianae]MBT2187498.1 phytanoyl-CoA dioxygenase family protein [Sphingobium nicotianae]